MLQNYLLVDLGPGLFAAAGLAALLIALATVSYHATMPSAQPRPTPSAPSATNRNTPITQPGGFATARAPFQVVVPYRALC